MKRLLLWAAVILTLFSMPGWSGELPTAKNSGTQRYSMLMNSLSQRLISSNVILAACTGANTCCCRAGSQIFCTTPGACSRMGGACSAGCN